MKAKETQKQPEIKYLCVGGNTFDSAGAVHFIAAEKLPELYDVSPELCIFANKETDLAEYDVEYLKKLTTLMPRSDGKYTLATLDKKEQLVGGTIILPEGVNYDKGNS